MARIKAIHFNPSIRVGRVHVRRHAHRVLATLRGIAKNTPDVFERLMAATHQLFLLGPTKVLREENYDDGVEHELERGDDVSSEYAVALVTKLNELGVRDVWLLGMWFMLSNGKYALLSKRADDDRGVQQLRDALLQHLRSNQSGELASTLFDIFSPFSNRSVGSRWNT